MPVLGVTRHLGPLAGRGAACERDRIGRSDDVRDAVYRRGKAAGFAFAQVVHPSARVSGSAHLGEGAQVMAGCVIQTGANIGANSIVNTRASIDHDCTIGETVHIAPGVTLSATFASAIVPISGPARLLSRALPSTRTV